ncbi:MAG: hypothetical protein ACOCQE_04765 [Halanaerobium sp.]
MKEIKEKALDRYKELFQSGEVTSINEFVDRQRELLDLEEDQTFSYSTFYRWTRKREDLKDLKGEPVQLTKNHKRLEKEVDQQEKEVDEGEENELEIKNRIENLDRIETENPESKEEQKEENTEIIEKVKSNINYNKLAIAGGITAAGLLTIFLISRSKKKKKNKEVINPDVKTRINEQQPRSTGFSDYPSPADF